MSVDYFSYNDGKGVINPDDFRISPSGLYRFFSHTNDWYREHVIKDPDAGFQGNDSSFIGDCVHAMAHAYKDTGRLINAQCEAYIDKLGILADKTYIRQQYPVMAQVLIDQYVSKIPKHFKAEPFLYHEIMEGVGVGGSIDVLGDRCVTDYKTTSNLNAPTYFSKHYWFQLMTYAFLARKEGYDIDTIRIVFVTHNTVNRISERTRRPMKNYPSTVSILEDTVTEEGLILIEDVLHLVAESVIAYKEKPELRHLLAQDMRLKERIARPSMFDV